MAKKKSNTNTDSKEEYTKLDALKEFATKATIDLDSKLENSFFKSEDFKKKMEGLRERYIAMGGEEGLKWRERIIKSLNHYYSEAPDGSNIKEYILEKFRSGVTMFGYKGIEKEMIPIVQMYGSVKDRVSLALTAHFDMKANKEKKPLLSLAEANKIKAKIANEGEEARNIFSSCVATYDAIVYSRRIFYRIKNQALAIALQATIYFQTYEWLKNTENLINSFSSLVPEDREKDFKEIVSNYNSYLNQYQRFGEITQAETGEGWVERQAENCYEYASVITEFYSKSGGALKGFIESVEEWAKERGHEMVVPYEFKQQFGFVKNEIVLELQEKYYQYSLKSLDDPTEEQKKLAIFPTYEELQTNTKTKADVRKQLEEFISNR